MTHAEIREAILTNGWQGKSPGEIAALLNEPKVVLVERLGGKGAILAACDNGAQILEDWHSMLSVEGVDLNIKWGWDLLCERQLDFGNAKVRLMLDVMLPVETYGNAAATLKGLAEQAVSANVTAQQVIDAMEGM